MGLLRGKNTVGLACLWIMACSNGAPERNQETPFSVSEALSQKEPSAKSAFSGDPDGFVATLSGFASRAPKDGAVALRAELPMRADEATRLNHPGVSLGVRVKDASSVAGAVDRGRVVYPGIFPGVDRFVTSNAARVEEWMLIRSAAARRSFEWDIASADVANASSDGKGGLSFYGRDGRVSLHVPKPFGVDAKGERFDALLAWDSASHTMKVSLPTTDSLTFPVLLDPAFEVSVWQMMGTPAANDSPVMVFDAARGHSVLVSAGVTYTSNGLAWARTPTAGPTSRALASAAYDPARQRVVYFGGKTATAQADTWEWDGTSWTSLFPTKSPPARYAHSMAYDPVRERVVLFGGAAADGTPLSDLWEWDGKNWAEITAVGPSPRAGQSMALDGSRKKIVVFGGGTLAGNAIATSTNETWEWDGTAWTQLLPATAPSARGLASITFNTKKNRVVLFGGETTGAVRNDEQWEWDGAIWTKSTLSVSHPSARSGAALSFDSFRDQAVLIGGAGATNETWFGDDVTWTSRAKVDAPSLLLPSLVYDAARQKVIMFGGSTPTFANNFIGNLYEWDGGGWVAAGSGPAVTLCGTGYFFNGFTGQWQCSDSFPATSVTNHIFAPAVAYDATRSVVVAFGGTGWEGTETLALIGGGPPFTREVSTNETWVYNGTWTKKSPTHSPNPRREAAMVNAGTKLVLFGGYGASDTWTWDGTDWTQITPATAPSARGGAGMAYDPDRAKVVLFGGSTNSVASGYSGVLADTWEFDPVANTWTNKMPATTPDADAFPSVQYDPVHKKIVMFAMQKNATAGTLHQWAWDGTDWADITSGSPPPVRRFARVVFDEARKEFVMHGGGDVTIPANATGETWTYYTRGGECTTTADCSGGLYCTDGVCCEAETCGTCAACNVAGFTGTCAKVTSANDSDTCTGTKTCDEKGACKVAPGQACTKTSECAAGFCVDGVCCETECSGACQACRADLKAAGESGTCGPVKAGLDPRDECAAEDQATCGLDGTCDGAGACRKFPSGTSCASAGHTSVCVGNRATGFICDGKGTCGNSSTGTECGSFVCDVATGGCPSACTDDAQCVAPLSCDKATGACAVKSNPKCKDEKTLTQPDGTNVDCGAYRCNQGKCNTGCTSASECSSGNVCSSGACAPGSTENDAASAESSSADSADNGGCGCESAPRRGTHVHAIAAIAVIAAIGVRRSRRARKHRAM